MCITICGKGFPECNIMCYKCSVIKTFRHRGVEKFFKDGSRVGIQAKHEARLRILLTTLNLASTPMDMNRPGWELHPLKGDLRGQWSVRVSGNWRLTFSFEGEDAILVDYLDYH
jgi:toxin HigB-1